MKKMFAFGVFAILLISMFSIALAESNDSNVSDDGNDSETGSDVQNYSGSNETLKQQREFAREEFKNREERIREEMKQQREFAREEFKNQMEMLKEQFKQQMREHNGSFEVEDEREGRRNITISELNDTQKEIIAGKINARTGLNLTAADIGNGSLGKILRAYLSNGNYTDLKIMPDRASEIALKRLGAKCEERNCTVELKEVGIGNKTRAAWVVDTQKDSKLFFFFGKKMPLKAEVDPETGEVIKVHKPWWAFLAREKDESATDDSNNDNNSTSNETADVNVSVNSS